MPLLHVARGLTTFMFCLLVVAVATAAVAAMIYLGVRVSFTVGRERINDDFVRRAADSTRVVTVAGVAAAPNTATVKPPAAVRYMAESSWDWLDVHGVPPKCDTGYRMIELKDTSDVFFDGRRRTDAPAGLYCVRQNVSVIRCNEATSRLEEDAGTEDRNGRRRWFCAPRWPDVFGGRDGGDVVVCGGSVFDEWSGLVYTRRLPPSADMKPVKRDPRTERIRIGGGGGGADGVYRWRCATESVPVDHMGNRYLESPTDRLKRTRNECAEHIYQAVSQIAPSVGRPGFCDCLATSDHGSTSEHRRAAPLPEQTERLVSVPHPCSPCVAGGGPDDGSYVVGLARSCVKSYARRHDDGSDDTKPLFFDRLPCGTTGFDALNASCTSGKAYVGVGLSEYGRRLVGLKTLSSR